MVHNEIIPKRLYNPLSVALYRSLFVILIRIFQKYFLVVFYQNSRFLVNRQFRTAKLASSLTGNMSSKNVAYLDYIIIPTCLSGTPDFTTKKSIILAMNSITNSIHSFRLELMFFSYWPINHCKTDPST